MPEPEELGPVHLSDTEIDAIVARLHVGQYLDDHLRERLFQRGKDAELEYAGKQSRGAILAETMAVPLQVLKRFGNQSSVWHNKIVCGDNLQVLKTLLELKERGELCNSDGSPGVRLCYIDPPFATKREFRTAKGQVAYRDKVEGAEFMEFLRKRLVFIHELLSDDGVLYLHLDTNKAHYMKVLLDEIFGPENFRAEIIWKRSTAHSDARQGRRLHGRIHDIILFYSKGPQWTWNTVYTEHGEAYIQSKYPYVEEATNRRYGLWDMTAPGGATKGNPRYDVLGITRYWRYSQERMKRLIEEGRVVQPGPGKVPRFKRYLDESEGVAIQDVWADIDPVNAMAIERVGYPTQKPVALLDRIIKSSSNTGDLILDCFAGSGTTAVAAQNLNRRWITVDCGKFSAYLTQRRLLAVTEGDGTQRTFATSQPFEFCTAGLYDNDLLEKLSYERYEGFCLELFGCRPKPHTVGHVPMAGTRKGAPVHCFPFNKTDALMGRAYIESLHERIQNKVSGSVYVIVPVSVCDPGLFEDIIVIGENSYFILRVPYSVIEAIHGRDFELVTQAGSVEALNDALDSFGFDFAQVPEVQATYAQRGSILKVNVHAFMRGGLDPDEFPDLNDAGRGDIAMVMIDPSYDGKVFRVGDFHFGDELASHDWSFTTDLTGARHSPLLIYIDIHGNELHKTINFAASGRESRALQGLNESARAGT